MIEKYSSKQFLQIPYDIIAKCDNPLDAMIWAYIFGWENSKRDDRVKLKSSSLAEFFGVGSATVDRSIKRLKDLGLIGTKQTVHGCFYTTRQRTIDKFHVHQNDGDKSIKVMESCPSKRLSHVHQDDGHHSIRSSVLDHSINNSSSNDDELAASSSSESPSFRPDQIQAMRGYGWHERKSLRPMATLSAEDTDHVARVFGAGKVDDIRTILCQDMADAPGFVERCCKVVKSRMERGLDNPVGYFDGVVRGTWKNGNYAELLKRDQQEAEAKTKRIKEMFNVKRS